MLIAGIVVLVVSILVERVATIRSASLVDAAGGTWEEKDVRYSHQGGAPRWLSAVALIAYAGIAVGVLLILVGLVL
jgi:hypothetical protein